MHKLNIESICNKCLGCNILELEKVPNKFKSSKYKERYFNGYVKCDFAILTTESKEVEPYEIKQLHD